MNDQFTPFLRSLRKDGYTAADRALMAQRLNDYNNRVVAAVCFTPAVIHRLNLGIIQHHGVYHPVTLTELVSQVKDRQPESGSNFAFYNAESQMLSLAIPHQYQAKDIHTLDVFFYPNGLVIQRPKYEGSTEAWTLSLSFRPSNFSSGVFNDD